MPTEGYRVCTRCIMDTTDPDIEFDENGVCSDCRRYEELAQRYIPSEREREVRLERLLDTIKANGKGKEYDCIVGVSGGVDSTYTIYMAKKLGLRPLAVHMDNGWNSELAVSNIEQSLKVLEIDLLAHVLDWKEFRDLQTAFLYASVPDAEIPTDHAIVAVLHRAAVEKGIRYIISGTNITTEAILPGAWTYGVLDWQYLSSVHQTFSRTRLRSYPHVNLFQRFLFYPIIKRVQTINLLDYLDYNRATSIQVLSDEVKWRPYGGKHCESIYTRFFQGYILPRKFGIDKRRAHLSTLIMSGQITRQQALQEITTSSYSGCSLEEDMEYVLKKLCLTRQEFEHIMSLPVRSHRDYSTSESLVRMLNQVHAGKWARRIRLLPSIG